MSSGRNRDDCPECGYRKPGHKVRCRFGAALAEGRAQAERELMSPQMRALRGVVAEQVYQPVILTGQGFADMVDRITRAVAEHVGAVPVTPEVEAAAREGWESHGPQGAAVASGCPGCGAVPTRTRQGRSILHAATCPRVLDARTPSDPSGKRYGECPQTERHTAHQWTGGVGDEVRYWCDGEPSADGS